MFRAVLFNVKVCSRLNFLSGVFLVCTDGLYTMWKLNSSHSFHTYWSYLVDMGSPYVTELMYLGALNLSHLHCTTDVCMFSKDSSVVCIRCTVDIWVGYLRHIENDRRIPAKLHSLCIHQRFDLNYCRRFGLVFFFLNFQVYCNHRMVRAEKDLWRWFYLTIFF